MHGQTASGEQTAKQGHTTRENIDKSRWAEQNLLEKKAERSNENNIREGERPDQVARKQYNYNGVVYGWYP